MKISVLIPSINGFRLLSESVNSIFEKMSGNNQIEVIIKFDFGDETILRINELNYKDKIKIYITDKGLGYGGIHLFLNDMLNLCKDSDWIQLFNDDALVLTQNWDTCLEKYNPDDVWLFRHIQCEGRIADRGDYYFPIISRKYHQVVGRLSGSPAYDGYLLNIGETFNISEQLPLKYYHRHAHELADIPEKGPQMVNSRKNINEQLELQTDKNKIENYLKK